MRSNRTRGRKSSISTRDHLRMLLHPVIAAILALSAVLLSAPARTTVASVLERSIFFPYRLAVGWGARSLLAERELLRLARLAREGEGAKEEKLETDAENVRLRALVGFERRSDAEWFPGVVIGRGRSRLGDLLLVRVTDPFQIEIGQPVADPSGLLGRVLSVSNDIARVEGLRNRNVAVSVVDQRSREEGIARWDPSCGSALSVQGVPAQADWQVGDRVVTSGLGSVFPRGLLVGYVMGVREEGGGLLRSVGVRPASSFDRASEVLFLVGGTNAPGAEGTGVYPFDPLVPLSREDRPAEGTLSAGARPAP